MKTLVKKSLFGWSKLPVFLSGLVIGAIVALSSPGLSAGEDSELGLVTASIYAIASLAVTTETNASRIVTLTARVEDLEETLQEMSGGKQ